MKAWKTTAIILILGSSLFAQNPTWVDVAPIIYENCSSCHHEGAIAPFPLMSYADAASWWFEIKHEITERKMPPWPPNPAFRHFANETYLTEEERDLILAWTETGLIEGDPSLAPLAPEFPEGGIFLDTIDFHIDLPAYTLQFETDELRWFSVSNPFDDTIYINKLEVLPGLEEVVHHVDLYYDLSLTSAQNDLLDTLPGFNSSTGSPNIDFYINAWQPGAAQARYPKNWGIMVPPNADFMVEIHYGPDGQGKVDETDLFLQFTRKEDIERAVRISWYLGHTAPSLVDGPLFIPADSISTFHQESNPLPRDMSLIAICPHMHFLGATYKVWAETPDQMTIPLIDIDKWDFHWQKYYYFKKVQKIPAGSIIYSEASFNNTMSNHDNPSIPPIDVGLGQSTEDEMLLCLFIYADYEEGDEFINMEENFVLEYPSADYETSALDIQISPNPVRDILFVEVEDSLDETFEIFDTQGKSVRLFKKRSDGQYDLSDLKSGIYFLHLENASAKFFKL